MSDRKYRQRGYQDDDRRERPRRQGPPPPRREGPRGRGVGAPTETAFRCARCGFKRPLRGGIDLEATCGSCGSDLHTCTNCLHFDTSAPGECRKPIVVPIRSKAKRNDCELFAPKTVAERASDSGRAADPRAEFDALFDF